MRCQEEFIHGKGGQALNGLPRETPESPSPDIFKRCVDVAHTVLWWTWKHKVMAGLDDLVGLFQSKQFYDSLKHLRHKCQIN